MYPARPWTVVACVVAGDYTNLLAGAAMAAHKATPGSHLSTIQARSARR